MHRGRPFAVDDPDWCRSLARRHPFATVVANGEDGGAPRVAHVPVVVDADADRLALHVAAANPLADLRPGDAVTVVFHGAHAHVSAAWYEHPEASVPTWDYEAVHATASVARVLTGDDATDHLRRLADTVEGPDGWSVDEASGHVSRLLPGIVALALAVERWEGISKLSQNRSDADRRSVAGQLTASEDPVDRAVGRLVAARMAEHD